MSHMILRYTSPSAEQDSAEVSGYNDADIGQTSLFQDVEHRHTGSALRFAVVRIPGNIILSEDIGVNVVFSLAMLGFYGIHEFHSLVIGGDGGDIADKLRVFLDKRVLSRS